MIVRFILLIVSIGFIILSICVKKVRIISIVCCILTIVFFLNTFFTAVFPVVTKLDRAYVTECVVSNFSFQTNIDHCEELYLQYDEEGNIKYDEEGNVSGGSHFFFYRIPLNSNMENKLTPYKINELISGCPWYSSGLCFIDRLLLKVSTNLLTKKELKNGVEFWLLPTLLHPWNPNSFFLKGCTYTELYVNAVAWRCNDSLFLIVERCDSSIGSRDDIHFEQFIKEYLSTG